MIFNALIITVCALVRTLEAQKYSVSDFAIAKNCTEVYTNTTTKNVPYPKTYITTDRFGFKKSAIGTNYRKENHTSSYNRSTCCNGYEAYGDDHCIPVCSRGCKLNGICSAPETCRCNEGYHLDHTTNECKPMCLKECINGFCVSPYQCACKKGFRMLSDGFTCQPACADGCTHGTCTAPDTCKCLKGYALRANRSNICDPVCKDECINAKCIAPNTCSCYDGYRPEGPATSHICRPCCKNNCKHGKCTAPDKCTCDPGYSWNRSTNSCEPVCTENCVKGSCTAPETCTCLEGYQLAQESKFACQPVCQEPCVNGYCSAPNECTCNNGYEKKSNAGESSKCVAECECENGHCDDNSSTCRDCAEGYDLAPSVGGTTICGPHCDGGCSERGQCVEPQKCECPYGWIGKHCEESMFCAIFVMEDDPEFAIIDKFHGYNAFENASSIESPWTGPVCSDECKDVIDNNTLCSKKPAEFHSNVTCFIDINSLCNSYIAVISNTHQSQISMVTIVASSVFAILCITAVVCTGLFIRRRNTVGSFDIRKSVKLIKQDGACLIKNEADKY